MIPLRDENPTRHWPVVTVLLILTCGLVFLWQSSLSSQLQQQAVYTYGLTPGVLFGYYRIPDGLAVIPGGLTLFSSMFLHGSVWHLLGNMLYLWVFGDNIEDVLGTGRYVVFYLLCGLAAAMAQALPDPASTTPMIGASGAISGVLGGYLVLFPGARIFTVIPLGLIIISRRLPAILVLGVWFGVQLFSQWHADPSTAGVAWRAHIGGFVAGMVLILLMKRRHAPSSR